MCGIFGTIGYQIDENQARECLRRMKHRGPDGEGVWQKDDVTFGHCRLSILDLSDNAVQPMSFQNGRYEITFNGEIYNFVELRRELQSYGYQFRSDSDTEVILAAYDKWKEGCLSKMNGMWSFAIWDCMEQRLFIARDRFGIKPLFYHEELGRFAFASEMKALVPILGSVSMNTNLIADIQKKGVMFYESEGQSLISEIKRFPAASYGIYEPGRLMIRKWWNSLDELPDIPPTYEEQAEMFRCLFLDACKIRMRSDVTLGTALSGGLDSSATLCTMSHLAKQGYSNEQRINANCNHAYVATFPGTALDESAYARIVTDYLGIDATFIDIDPNRYVDNLENDLYLFEEIYTTSPIPMMATYGAMKKGGITVTIDGHGADELLGGYAFDLPAAFPDAKGNRDKIDLILRTYSDCFPHDDSNTSVKSVEQDYSFYRKKMLDYYKTHILQWKNDRRLFGRYSTLDAFSKRLYKRSHIDILPTIIRNYDRYSMSQGVEVRMPFMDYRIVTMALALPWTSKLHGGYTKSIVRDALQGIMPEQIVRRKTKIGFNTPVVEWMQGRMKEYLLDLVSSQDYRANEHLVGAEVKSDVFRVCNGGKEITYYEAEDTWRRLSPYLWKRCFYDRVTNA